MSQKEVYYKDYLQLDKILNAQALESDAAGVDAHDEMLFIVIHQAYELWFKQVLFEVDSILDIFNSPKLDDNDPTLQVVVHRCNRINTILKVLVEQMNIMETMTSLDFLDFRDLLRPASGFQSVQWKELEAKLGLVFEARHGKHYYTSQLRPEDVDQVKQNEQATSLLEYLNAWLERMPFMHDAKIWGEEFESNPTDHPFWKSYREVYTGGLLEIESANIDQFDSVMFGAGEQSKSRRLSPKACRAALFITLYQGFPMLQQPYQLLDALLETDTLMATWRSRHMNMVGRMIGTRVGTGNSSGRGYLKAAMDKHYVFQELAQLNGLLVRRGALPELPEALRSRLGFS